MSFNVVVSPDAFEELKRVEPERLVQLLPCISSALENLGQDPVGLGQRPLVPYPESGQVYYFDCRADGVNYWLAAIFAYDQNEADIHILRVTFRRIVM